MISKLHITNIKYQPIEYLDKIQYFVDHPITHFTDGLNILVGMNGCGKTTFLKLMAKMMHCEQGGRSVVTQNSVGSMMINQNDDFTLNGIDIENDGQSVGYLASEGTVGMSNGRFDYDFFEEGATNLFLMKKSSSGISRIQKFSQIISGIEKHPICESNIDVKYVNNTWQRYYNETTRVILNPTLPKGKPTLLLDEPDKSASIIVQYNFKKVILGLLEKYQIIMSSHNIFWLSKKMKNKINLIEMSEGYIDSCYKIMEEL